VTSFLLPSAVAVLAHKRLVDVIEALERKIGGDVYDTGVEVRDTDRRVLALAKAAREMLEAGPKVEAPERLTAVQGVGRFAILGAVGFELPSYVEVFAANPGWRSDAMRRGTPDPNLSKVVVGTTQFAIRAGQLSLGRATNDEERRRIRSFTMGLLSGLAAGVVVDPVLRGLQARLTRREWNRNVPAPDIAAAEARVLRGLLGGPSGASVWQSWWPAVDDVPDSLLHGFADAAEEVYFLGGQRPQGFAEFELGFDPGSPLTVDRLRDAYTLLRLDVGTSSWSWIAWLGLLTPVVLAPAAGLAIAHGLSHSGVFFSEGSVDQRAVHQLLSLGFGVGAVMPFIYSMVLWSQIPEQTEPFVNALLLGLLRAGLVPANLAAAGNDADEALLWLLFALLAGADVYAAVRGIRAKKLHRPGGFVFLLQTLPAMTAASMFLQAGLLKLLGVTKTSTFWILWGVSAGVHLLAIGLPLAIKFSNLGGFRRAFFLPEPFPLSDGLRGLREGENPAALARVFDDAVLWELPAVAAPTLADLRYPSGPRTVVRLWWTGAGDLTINHAGRTVTFKPSGGAPVPVTLPPGRTSAADLVRTLKAALPGLEAEVFHQSDPLYDLPYPQTLADPGDDRPTLAEHAAHAGDVVAVGKTKDTAYLLRHAPRVALDTTFSATGPSRSETEGFEVAPGAMLGDVDGSALGSAADLAALLSMAAAPSLGGGTVPVENRAGRPNLAPVGRVYQVFRQWNLDERRVNEWRMLVAGGAESEKGGDARQADAAMRPLEPETAPPYRSPADDGEPLANALGWVPLWRAWTRIAADVTADTGSELPMPYTPTARLPGRAPAPPSNGDLTTAIRFLLDLPA
jgi:hypothetical protein